MSSDVFIVFTTCWPEVFSKGINVFSVRRVKEFRGSRRKPFYIFEIDCK